MCGDKAAQHEPGGGEAESWKEREDADILQVQIITDYLTHLHIPHTLQRELTDTFGCLVVVCAGELSSSVCECRERQQDGPTCPLFGFGIRLCQR